MAASTVRRIRAVHRRRWLTIEFDGEIADRFAPSYRWLRQSDDDQMHSAFQAFAVNYPGFESYLYECDRLGIQFAATLDDEPVDDFMMFCALGKARRIVVSQIPAGAGNGLFKGLLGVAFLTAGVLTMGGSIGVGGALFGISGKALAVTGAAMTISALQGVVATEPIIQSDKGNDKESSYFTQTSAVAGDRVLPALYGTPIVELNGQNVVVGQQVPGLRSTLSIKYTRLVDEDN